MSEQAWSVETASWMKWLGDFGPTVHGTELKGWMDDDGEGRSKVYLSANDLRALAAACLEAADSLKGASDGPA